VNTLGGFGIVTGIMIFNFSTSLLKISLISCLLLNDLIKAIKSFGRTLGKLFLMKRFIYSFVGCSFGFSAFQILKLRYVSLFL